MNNLEAHIKLINEKLQQLLKKHVALKKENDNLNDERKKTQAKRRGL